MICGCHSARVLFCELCSWQARQEATIKKTLNVRALKRLKWLHQWNVLKTFSIYDAADAGLISSNKNTFAFNRFNIIIFLETTYLCFEIGVCKVNYYNVPKTKLLSSKKTAELLVIAFVSLCASSWPSFTPVSQGLWTGQTGGDRPQRVVDGDLYGASKSLLK